ncbi:hypothetical protein BGX38DRAFT_1232996 [Terfezia claveryi]|nr:hypothetical protein BGX38DRAFT_1232996 [Terfezia claveryi]
MSLAQLDVRYRRSDTAAPPHQVSVSRGVHAPPSASGPRILRPTSEGRFPRLQSVPEGPHLNPGRFPTTTTCVSSIRSTPHVRSNGMPLPSSIAILQTLPTPSPSSPPCPADSPQPLSLHPLSILSSLEPAVGPCTPVASKCETAVCQPMYIQLCDLTPPLLLELIQFYGQDYIILHVSCIQFEHWLSLYPELENDRNRENNWLRYMHAEVSIDQGVSVPGLIVKCMPSAYHDSCSTFLIEETIAFGLSCFTNTAFHNFTNYASNLSSTTGKTPDMVIVVGDLRFPTIAIEVGFSEQWALLLEDARLFLIGMRGITKFIVLIHLAEEIAKGEYMNYLTGEKVKCWKAKEAQFRGLEMLFGEVGSAGDDKGSASDEGSTSDEKDCGNEHNRGTKEGSTSKEYNTCKFYSNGLHIENIQTILIPPLPPNIEDINNQHLFDDLHYQLTIYFLTAEVQGTFLPPLLELLSAMLYYYHLCDTSSPVAPDANNETDTTLFYQTNIPFMEQDLPIPEASFELELGKLYPALFSEGHIGVEVPKLVQKLILNEEKIVYNLVVLGIEITEDLAGSRNVFIKVKQVWVEVKTEKCGGREEVKKQEEEVDDEDDITKDGNWTL